MKLKVLACALVLCLSPSVTQGDTPPVLIKSFPPPGSPHLQLNSPNGLFVDALGNVYVADSGNRRVMKFTNEGAFLQEINGPGIVSPIDIVGGSDGRLFMSQGGILDVFDSSFGFLAEWSGPFGSLAMDAAGQYIYSTSSNLMYWYRSSDGTQLGFWGFAFSSVGPGGFGVGPSGNVYVSADGFVRKFGPSGAPLGEFILTRGGGTLAVDPSESIVVASDDSHLQKYSSDGALIWETTRPAAGGVDVALDGAGNIYVLSEGSGLVYKFGDVAVPARRHSWGALKAIFR